MRNMFSIRTFIKGIVVAIMAFSWGTLLASSESASAFSSAEKPNIIFIFADDWGYGDLGCYGHKEVATPNLDNLASQGTLYTQFHVTSGVCSPSRTSVITGHFPAPAQGSWPFCR